MGQPTYVRLNDARTVVKDHGRAHDNKGTSIRRYFGPGGVHDLGSEAFRVDVQPHVTHRAHFHHVDQFQVFFGASDTIHQGRRTGPLLVQYTDADTLYGPFAAGHEPYKYVTLRRRPSTFTGFIPEDRADLVTGFKKRHYKTDLASWVDSALPTVGSAVIESFLPEHPDGLAGYRISLGPAATLEVPAERPGGGQYHLIIDGAITHNGKALPDFTIGWVAPEDRPPTWTAGERGARVLVLQYGLERTSA